MSEEDKQKLRKRKKKEFQYASRRITTTNRTTNRTHERTPEGLNI